MKLGLYKHYKGNLYQVIGIARHTESGDELVVYQALYGDYGLWVRPKNMFCKKIMYNEEETNRFTFIKDPLNTACIMLPY